ncbi:MAG: aminoglycoside 3'-phosphotransferase/choline kinase family protein [Ktedonobacteraceae bacterium]
MRKVPGAEPLLPPVTKRADYESMRINADMWPRAMQVICQRHGLSSDRLVRFGDGTDPADGTNVVFAAGEQHIIKLFPPYWRRLFEADLTVSGHVYGKLSITTPEIYAHGILDGWPYLVMSRVPGVYLSEVWDTLEQENQLRIVTELGEVVAHLHALPTKNLPLLEANWPEFVATRVKNCLQRHSEQGVSDYWLQQIPKYLEYASPLYPPDFTPAIVSGDIHQHHLLAHQQEYGQWRLTGLFDFDDARIGFHEYDLAAAGLFMMADNPTLLRAFLLAYGYAETDIDEPLSHRLMAYTLLHRYRPFNWVREDFTKYSCTTLEELARVIYAL